MILLAFHISHSLNTKGHAGSEKTYSNFIQSSYLPNALIWIKVLCNDCITCQLNKSYPHQKQIAQEKIKGQSLYLTTESHLIQKDQYHPLQKETHI